MKHSTKQSPAALAGAHGAAGDLAKINNREDSDLRAVMQRRLAMKLAAGAGLSLAMASCVVVLALGDGGAQ